MIAERPARWHRQRRRDSDAERRWTARASGAAPDHQPAPQELACMARYAACDRRRRLETPVLREVRVRARASSRRATSSISSCANLLLAIVHDRRAPKHRVPATAGLPIVVERQRERVRVGDRLAVDVEQR